MTTRIRVLAILPMLLAMTTTSAAAGVSEQARMLHERLLVLDTHLDTPALLDNPAWDITERHPPDVSQVDYPRMVEGGLDGGFWVVYTPQRGRSPADNRVARDHGLRRLINVHRMLAAHPDKFELALTSDDARRIAAAGRRVVFISMENAAPLTTDPVSLLRFFHSQGLRMLSLVHGANNEFADSGTALPEWRAISPAGRELITEANRLGIVLDQSHASDDAFDELITLSKAPIVLSHTSAAAVYAHPRNIDDERLRRLAASGGVIHVNCYGDYLVDTGRTPENRQGVRPATLEDFLRHLEHILDVVGPDHVGIGADWDGGGGAVGFEDITALPKITQWLLDKGYSERQIGNIWSGNLLRVLDEAQRVAREMAARP